MVVSSEIVLPARCRRYFFLLNAKSTKTAELVFSAPSVVPSIITADSTDDVDKKQDSITLAIVIAIAIKPDARILSKDREITGR